jgi:hypothetical protein
MNMKGILKILFSYYHIVGGKNIVLVSSILARERDDQTVFARPSIAQQ